ncbi:MAG: hypothetical protein P1S60_14250 [Anaerolineae bacterium]|nr:hypothetical protein [Anaerolineae bacterium]
MSALVIGTSAYPGANDALIKEANAIRWRQRGFPVMGVTPLMGIGVREPDPQGHLENGV